MLKKDSIESPFLDQELFVERGDPKSERRAAALAAGSPFQHAFEEGWRSFDAPEMEAASELSPLPVSGLEAEDDGLAAVSGEPPYQEAESLLPSEADDHEPPAAGRSSHGEQAEESEARSASWEFETEGTGGDDGETDTHEVDLEENEFRVDRLPTRARAQFAKTDSAAWRDAIDEAIGAGVKNPNNLADLIFFMQHRDRVVSGIGKLINRREPDFFKLRAEWNLYRTIARRRLDPSTECSVFLPAQPSSDYERYVAKPTTGHIALLVNGRTSGANKTDAFDKMQQTVESLGPGDTVYLAAFQVRPTKLTGPRPPGITTWADLFVSKAKEGVKIRIIMTDFPKFGPDWKSDLNDLNAAIGRLPVPARDNLKYIVSMHPAQLRFIAVGLTKQGPIFKAVPTGGIQANVATHHQKFMVVKKTGMTVAYCGGLDISPARTPEGWPDNKLQPKGGLVWHDTHVKLEGLIARDLEREFVLRWNREKDKSTAAKLPDWKSFEKLAQSPLGSADRDAARNAHKLQMLRTVSVGATYPDIRRDDVWRGYFRLIGCATRFLFMENQYFHEPAMADAIVKQAEAQPDLIIIIVVAFEIDDPTNQFTEHGRALQNEFFKRLFKIPASRRRVYTMLGRLVHAKLILVDDQALSVGSTNANPRDFFMDTQLNVMLDDPQAVKGFRHQLWSHDLGLSEAHIAGWAVSDFITQWDVVAKANELLKATPEKMTGEGVIPFDPSTVKGKLSAIPDILAELDGEDEQSEEAGESEDQWAEAEADNYEGDVGFEHPGVSEFQAEPAEHALEALEVRDDRAASEDETPVIIQHDVPKTPALAPLGRSDFWPDIAYIVAEKDSFLNAAREFHNSWGLKPVEFGSFETLIGLIGKAKSPEKRIRVISHAWDGFKIPLFNGSPAGFLITQRQIEALNAGDGALMDELLGTLANLDQTTDQGFVLWSALLSNLESSSPGALKPFGLSSKTKPSGDEGLLLRRCADLVAVASANPVFEKAVRKSIAGAQGRLKGTKAEVDALEAAVKGSGFKFAMSPPTQDMVDHLRAAVDALDKRKFRAALKAARDKLKGKWLDFRGCRIGHQPKYLEALAILMGTDGCTAPDWWSGYPGEAPISNTQVSSVGSFRGLVDSSPAAEAAMNRWGAREVTGWSSVAAAGKPAHFFNEFLVAQNGVLPVYEVDYSGAAPKEKHTLYWNSDKGKERWLVSMWDRAPKKQVQLIARAWGAKTPRMAALALQLKVKDSTQASPQNIFVVPEPEFRDHIIEVKKP